MTENRLKTEMDKRLRNILEDALKYFDGYSPYISYPTYVKTVYPDNVQGIEAFARLLWGACFADDNVLSPEKKKQLMDAIASGTDKGSPYYFGNLTDYSQVAVEMTPIAFFVFQNRDIFYSYDKSTRKNIARWLYQINRIRLYNNNWQCFRVLVNLFLQLLGCRYSASKRSAALKNIEKMYLKDGWYSDGKSDHIDYYTSFAIHFYLLIYCRYCPEKEDTKKYLERSISFSETFIYWFSDTGAGIPFGRSLTYKFAQSAFWAALSINDVPEKYKLTARGLLERNLKWWFKQDIFDDNGLLALGYAYPNLQMTENYNAFGSSYWSLKTFIFLLIPSEDAFWNDALDDKPKLKPQILIPSAKMVICRDGGNPYAFVNGLRAAADFGHTDCKYEKFVYNSESGFCIPRAGRSLEMLAPDSSVSISLNGHDYITRKNYRAVKTKEDRLISVWNPAKGIKITTIVIPGAPAHTRVHYVETDVKMIFADTGFSIQSDYLDVSSSKYYIYAKNKKSRSSAGSVCGKGHPVCINAAPCTNILFQNCAIPAIKYYLKPGKYKLTDWFYYGGE